MHKMSSKILFTVLASNMYIFWKFCRSFAAVGVDPAVMGIGPAVAIPAAVKSAGLDLGDISLFEINEVMVLLFFRFYFSPPNLGRETVIT